MGHKKRLVVLRRKRQANVALMRTFREQQDRIVAQMRSGELAGDPEAALEGMKSSWENRAKAWERHLRQFQGKDMSAEELAAAVEADLGSAPDGTLAV